MPAAVVYVVRLRRPLCHARHYVGWTCDLPARVREHLSGQGSALLNAANAYGIGWDVVQVIACPSWKAAQALEQYVKRYRRVERWDPVARRAAGFDTVKCAVGRGPGTFRPVAEALASVSEAVRALTAGPEAVTPHAKPFAFRDFDPARAAALAREGRAAAPFQDLRRAAA